MRHQRLFANLGLILALSVSVAAEQAGIIRRDDAPQSSREIERTSVRFDSAWRPANSTGATKVVGTVIDVRQVPVADVRVQLRNLDTGSVVEAADSDAMGEYAFEVEESGTYVVEMVTVDGFVAALSNAGTLARYETLQTVVQLPGRWDFGSRTMVMPQSVANFFGMSAKTTMTAATIQSAIDQDITPANPGAPVSPQ